MFLCCFEAFWWKFNENLSFYSKNWLSQKDAQKYLQSLFLSTSLKRSKSRGKLGFVVKKIFVQSIKSWTNINKNCFPPQNEPHTAKLFFSVVLKHFRANSLKTSLFSQKVTILGRSTEVLRKLFFLTSLKRGNPEENLDFFKQLFFIKPVKEENINKNSFSPIMNHIQLNHAFLLFWSILGEIYWKLLFLIK